MTQKPSDYRLTLSQVAKQKNGAKPITIWFVRHGESTANVQGDKCLVEHDTQLTEIGRRESVQAAKYFKKHNVQISDVYSSPLKRCSQTADIIANEFNIPMQPVEDFRERQWGVFKDHTWKDLAAKLDSMTIEERYAFIPEGGESWQQMELRLFKELGEAISSASGDNIVVVTHRGCLRAILTELNQSDKSDHATHSVKTGSVTSYDPLQQSFGVVGEQLS